MSSELTRPVVGRHLIGEPLGSGGQATVYRGRHEALSREAAVKLFHPHVWADPAFRVRFRRECEALVALEHPHIIPVYDAGEASGRGYLVMRLARGGSLADRLAAGPLPPREATAVLAQVAAALDAAHAAGRLHRDLKPGNVLLEPGGHAWLADFGVARTVSATTNTGAGDIVGTPAYLAPEVVAGQPATAAADRYALACLAFECLTGRPPFEADRVEGLLYAHVHRRPPRASSLRPGLPGGLDALLERGLAKDPARRPASGAALVEGLAAAVAPGAPRRRWRRPARPRSAVAAIGAGLVLLGVAAGGLVVDAARSGGGGGDGAASRSAPPPLTVPGPTGDSVPAARAAADELPGLPAGVRAGVAQVAGVRVTAVPEASGVESAQAIAKVRSALENVGYSGETIEVDGVPVGTAEIQPLDSLIGIGPRWALLDLNASGGDMAVLVRGAPDAVDRYAADLARAHPGALRAP